MVDNHFGNKFLALAFSLMLGMTFCRRIDFKGFTQFGEE